MLMPKNVDRVQNCGGGRVCFTQWASSHWRGEGVVSLKVKASYKGLSTVYTI